MVINFIEISGRVNQMWNSISLKSEKSKSKLYVGIHLIVIMKSKSDVANYLIVTKKSISDVETHLIVIIKSKSDEVIYLFEIIRRVNQMWQFILLEQ